MSEENKIESFTKKLENADASMLVMGVILLLIPIVAIYFLTGSNDSGKKYSQEKVRSMAQRKNIFNFGNKKGNKASSSGPAAKSSSGNWFTAATPEQQIRDEVAEAQRIVDESMKTVIVPPNLTGDARDMYVAEHNFYLCMGNGALDARNYAEAEKYLMKAIDEAKDNAFLMAYSLGSLCALYEATGDMKKLEEAYKKYIEAVGKLPEKFGGGDLKSIVRNAYQSLDALGKSADPAKIAEEMDHNNLIQAGLVPRSVDLKQIANSFPIKYK